MVNFKLNLDEISNFSKKYTDFSINNLNCFLKFKNLFVDTKIIYSGTSIIQNSREMQSFQLIEVFELTRY